MNFYILFSFVNGLVAIIFGSFIFTKNYKNRINISFFLMSVAVAIWSFSYCVWLSATNEAQALFWSRMLNFGATLIPVFYLHWILSLLNIAKEKKHLILGGYLLTFVFAIFSFSPLYITSVVPVLSFPYWPQAGILYVLFLIFDYFGLTGYAIYQLFKARREADVERMHQINYVIVGSIFGFAGGASNFPLMFGISLIPPIGQSVVVFYIIMFGFATLKYHLFEIKTILTEMLIGVMGIIIMILFFLMPTTPLKLLTGTILFLFIIFGYYLIKAIHEELARKEEAERISKLKTEFISIVSHQLRTPLTAIRGYTSMLKDNDYGEIPTEAMKAINYIHESSIGMIKLVNSLLSVSRLEKGQIEFIPEDVSADDLLQECIKDIELVAKDKGLYIKYKKKGRKFPLIFGDSDKLKQSFSNIINNAVLYTPKGGVTITLEKNDFGFLSIQIKDTGVGIERQDLQKIFKSFSRGKGASELYTQGTGLGLYVAKNFIEMHQGKLLVESEGKNKGSTFTIVLPTKKNNKTHQSFVLTEKQ